ncbi:hypothetical protein FP744_10005804 [Trichoderma asperellum]|nr:hypothetical protein LI328DRAFT_152205 [Trichoderma asperelloides]
MVPKLRTKTNTRARVQRAPTKFSELEVTPSRPNEKQRPPSKSDKENLPLSQENRDECCLDDHDIGGSFLDETQDITNTASFAWSDAGSTNVTRRSTPAPPDDFPIEEFWDFDDEDDEVIEQMFSQDPKNKNLPDTVPLQEPSLTPGPQVDFSETASTIRRSSPFLTSDARKDIWDFSDSLSGSDSPPEEIKTGQSEKTCLEPNLGSQKIAIDDIYDATPKKDAAPAQVKTAVESKTVKSKTVSVIQDHSTTAVMHSNFETTSQPSLRASAKNKKHLQKAKEPIRFDPVTQEIVDIPVSKKKNLHPKRSIVSALQESAKGSSSPFVSTKKASRKQAPKQKQLKAQPAKKRKPEAEVAQHDSPSVDIFKSGPVKIVMAGSAEASPDLCPVHHENKAMETQPICAEDIPGPKHKQNEHLHQPSLAFNEASNGLESLSIRAPPKRRKISRQFTISEMGSPVVTRDAAPIRKADPAITELHPLMMESTNPVVAVQRPSFLRTASGDKLYGQQSDTVVRSIDGNAPSRWLRRVDEQKPCPKRNSSAGRNIQDNMMESFLQDTKPPQGLQDRRLDEVTNHGQVYNQICLTVNQLMVHLDGKKAAASKIVEAYYAGGTSSITFMQQQCLYDCQRVVATFRRHGALFDKNLQAAKDAIKTRRRARARTVGELDELLKSRNQAYGRARSNLGAV